MGLVIKLSMGSRASRDNPMVFMTQPVELSLLGSQDCGQLDLQAEQVPTVWPEEPGHAGDRT